MAFSLNNNIWEAALAGLEEQGRKLDVQIAEIRQLLGHRPGRQLQTNTGMGHTAIVPNTPARKRTLSAEARARIAKAQKLRWAKIKKAKKAA